MTGKPIARATDQHSCPITSLLSPPHAGGPILPPAVPSVIAVGQSVAKLADYAKCAVPPADVLSQAAMTVWVEGLYVVRTGDATAHGGVVTTGDGTVLVGGPVYTARAIKRVFDFKRWEWQFQYGSSIRVAGDPSAPNYQARVLAALIRLDSTPTAHRALDAIERSGKTITIIPYHSSPFAKDLGPNNAYYHENTVGFDPSNHVLGTDPDGHVKGEFAPGSDVILAHELIHGANDLNGEHGTGPINKDNSDIGEERNTVGLPEGKYNDPNNQSPCPSAGGNQCPNGLKLPSTQSRPYTENGVRDDYARRGIKSPATGEPPVQRRSYGGPGAPF